MGIEHDETVHHDPGEIITVFCATCETVEVGDIERFSEGVCWRCRKCGGAQDLSVVVASA